VRNICAGFADVTRIRRESGVNPAHMTRKCYAQSFRYDVRHVALILDLSIVNLDAEA
jgi:hypothetical protein